MDIGFSLNLQIHMNEWAYPYQRIMFHEHAIVSTSPNTSPVKDG